MDEIPEGVIGGVWVPRSVSDEPNLRLTDWSVFEVLMRGSPKRTRHFAGTSISGREGRVSSAVESFDPATRRGVTSSGRVYELVGSGTGLGSDADYVWNRWKSICQAQDVVDVTAEVKANIETQKNG